MNVIMGNNMSKVTACISTKDRYHTTLPLTIMSIINQTRKPDKLVIYDDGEQKDLRAIPLYLNLFKLLDYSKIQWEVRFGKRIGQVANHQDCLDKCDTEFIWRIDDDEVAEPNVLETLLNNVSSDEKIGAVGGNVWFPGNVEWIPSILNGSLDDVFYGLNIQWFMTNPTKVDVEHLYSTFLYSVEAGRSIGGYSKELSPVGHREETMFTYLMNRSGYITRYISGAITWHLREETGGIREYKNPTLWEQDEVVFNQLLKKFEVGVPDVKLIVLDNGIGDHYAFKSVLPLIDKDKDLVIACCYPEVFRGDNINLVSIAVAKMMCNIDDYNIYKWMWDKKWDRHITEAFKEMYSI